jgi:arsenite methyltransferase
MPDTLGLTKVLIREAFASRRFPRQPEPMVMDGAEQVTAYADSGRREDGIMAVSSLFHAAHATLAIRGCQQVIDLGCGPATQLVPIALLNPETRFVGVELAENMIDSAHELVQMSKVSNVEIVQGDITHLNDCADKSADGVISTMTLHHLPSFDHLRACFKQIRRILKPGGGLYLADFGRLKLLESVRFFAHMHEASLPPEVVQDYEYSLRAAFSTKEYQKLIQEELNGQAHLYQTFLAPFMVVVKSPDRVINLQLQSDFRDRREKLSAPFRRDLDDLRRFFRLGGLPGDPFQ